MSKVVLMKDQRDFMSDSKFTKKRVYNNYKVCGTAQQRIYRQNQLYKHISGIGSGCSDDDESLDPSNGYFENGFWVEKKAK